MYQRATPPGNKYNLDNDMAPIDDNNNNNNNTSNSGPEPSSSHTPTVAPSRRCNPSFIIIHTSPSRSTLFVV
ncbi:hypothetical protein BDN72DRAFT_907434 [Pluteus cervinus]|uniref:Uncharacterized protein n=1 Tax=Pluteus cervinus TaxID=181527 RepID=A0ACD2ZX82_9AGAR|nr:hypothetical protein BDN72DRAFT_907434 [Pluteus cervinus]